MKRRLHILDRLAGRLKPEHEASQTLPREQVAAAALLVECARIDTGFGERDRAMICQVIRERLGLDADTCDALVAVAERRTEEVWDDWIFVDAVKQGFSEQERIGIVSALWEVAYSDGRMHPFEEHLIGRIARELSIPENEIERTRAHAWMRLNEPEQRK